MNKKELAFYNYFDVIFRLAVVSFIVLAFLKVFYSGGLFVDLIEHIRASYFIQKGLIPYKDFFEHHNPLLWFVLSPLTYMLEGNMIIIPLARTFSVLGYLACIYITYVINKNFLYGKKAAEYSVLLLLAVPVWGDIANIRPDIFMMICFLCALYLFYGYMENKKVSKLIGCYTLLSISFLFLQKILFPAFGFGLVNLWFLYKKKIKIKDMLMASAVALVPLLIFSVYLLYNGIFCDWFYYNFIFNSILRDYYNGYQSVDMPLKVLFFASSLIIFKQYSNNEKMLPIFAATMFSALSLLYFFPHPQYAVPYFILASIYFGKFAQDIKIFSYRVPFIFCMVILFFSILGNYPKQEERDAVKKEFETAEYLNNIDSDKTVIPITFMSYPLFQLPLNYYWFGYLNVAIIDILYTQEKYFDLGEFIKKTEPEYLVYSGQSQGVTLPESIMLYHRKWFVKRNMQILKKMQEYPQLRSKLISIDADFWKIDMEWIKNNYTQIENTYIYKRNY